ncbi:hypothetical protein L1987_74089 [Smallanthus sonchifolius]|uniref:Uncharacterized protein n=1 Tax=Smallanthus sonchifolius TaxID=185202 RepID=A0ACB9A3B1_9ASTR|nr:hypothetical protein L1987_74089 [Smallanthus sonchifolius]
MLHLLQNRILCSGVLTDKETRFHAKVIPFVIILLPSVFGLSYSSEEYKIVLLVSLSASRYDTRIWKRRQEYAKVEQKVELHVPFYEVQELMLDREKHLMIKQKEMEKKLKTLENSENTMSKENFYEMFEKWLDETRVLMDYPYSFDKTGMEYNQVVGLLLEEKMKLLYLMSLMMKRRTGLNVVIEDVTVLDEYAIDRYQQDEAEAKEKEEKKFKAKAMAKEKFKAIILLIVGIFMLTALAEPLVESVRKFSESVNIEPFYVSFILVPLATNARTAIAAIRAANQKRHPTTSLTFSEIYHKVFLNNVLGFSVLVSVIYFRGLTWHFSAEVLVVVIVCVIMGLLTTFKSMFPNWTLLIAFPLYPLSMVAVYLVNDAFQFT